MTLILVSLLVLMLVATPMVTARGKKEKRGVRVSGGSSSDCMYVCMYTRDRSMFAWLLVDEEPIKQRLRNTGDCAGC